MHLLCESTVVESYEKCLKVIRWINPSNLKLLSIIENNIKMSELCSIHSLWKNKQLSTGLSSLPIITGWGDENKLYPSSFKLPLCWLHSLTPVT
ncbi:hypothetical protein CKY02_14240 [Photorhabdus bodei]|uniref:Uncharacterized protein n=1 Tax=Photorhabdus bodei TaxID=2029681 RepID=A0A329X5Z9_9GAMM|nr:hypothetical protein CKY02_14240 [Photorhabdus bodei]